MAGRFPILREANERRSFAIGPTGLDTDAQMLTITPGNLIFEKLLLHWLTANKSRKFQNALPDTSGAKSHLRPIRIVWCLERYHATKVSDVGVDLSLKRRSPNRLPRGTRLRKTHSFI
jgi:hypothetical protein|tara:strand:+ start:77959 stop:78312 length:354 start_codon:yes stop_codon:yes gene_type:complete